MAGDQISRRSVIQATSGLAGGVILGTGSGLANDGRSGDHPGKDNGKKGNDNRKTIRYNVGTRTAAGKEFAREKAVEVKREIDLGPIGEVVTGIYHKKSRDELEAHEGIRYVEEDITAHAIGHGSESETLPWGVDRVDAEVAAHNDSDGDGANETGAGAHIAILDSGIDDDHSDLNGNLATPLDDTSNHRAFVADGAGCGNRECTGCIGCTACDDDSNCNYPWSDDFNHGTHVAGIAAAVDNDEGAYGVASEATLHAAKVLDCNGCGFHSTIADGLAWVADQGFDIANLSLGSSEGSQTLRDACSYAYYGYSASLDAASDSGRGVLLVAAAGNSGPCTDCVGFPAAYNQVVAISAMKGKRSGSPEELADYSSTGPEVELMAPGGGDDDEDGSYEDAESVYSTVIGGYDYFVGTSMASPHAAAAGGLLMANGYTNEEARQQLQKTAEDKGLPQNEQGRGLVDPANALCLDSSDDGSNSKRFTCVTGRPEVFDAGEGDLKATLHGRWSCTDTVDSAGFKWKQIRPSDQADSDYTTVEVLTDSSTKDFSTEVDIADHSGDGDCAAYRFFAWAEAGDESDEGRRLGFWNSRTC